MNQRAYGFTIVELLIVIVVIGILAAISLVTYTDMRTKAENIKTVQAVGQYVKAIHSYASLNGDYPVDSAYPCLGPLGSTCGRVAGTGNCLGIGGSAARPGFDDAMKDIFGGSLPSLSSQRSVCGTAELSGGFYYSLNGKSAVIYYFLRGNQPCDGIGGVQSFSKGQQDDATRCMASMPVRA